MGVHTLPGCCESSSAALEREMGLSDAENNPCRPTRCTCGRWAMYWRYPSRPGSDSSPWVSSTPVSYTHLDVYKRQVLFLWSSSALSYADFFTMYVQTVIIIPIIAPILTPTVIIMPVLSATISKIYRLSKTAVTIALPLRYYSFTKTSS